MHTHPQNLELQHDESFMNQSPYTPPRIPPEDHSSDQLPKKTSWLRRFALSIIEIIVIAVSPIILIAWLYGLFYGWGSDNPLTFHLLYAILVLAPAIGAFIFAFTGHAPADSDNSFAPFNWIGTVCLCIIGTLVFSLYLFAVFSWHGLIKIDF